MTTRRHHSTAISSNKLSIILVSVLFAFGTYLFWMLDSPNDAMTWIIALLVSSVTLGALIGSAARELRRLGLRPSHIQCPGALDAYGSSWLE